jgi:hypothetical protein
MTLRFLARLFLVLLAGCASQPPAGGSFQVGAAMEDITPPVSWRRAGGYREEISTGVHDPLYAKALVFDHQGERAALVVCDLCSIGREVSDVARRKASERTGIPVSHIAISATHTHGGPEYYGVLWEIWRDSTIEHHGKDIHASTDYVARLIDGCVEAIAQADARKRPVTMDWGVPKLKGVAFNRRHLMKDGVTMMNPGKMNKNVVRAAGPVDEDFPILLFRDAASGRPVSSLSTFAMHVAVYGGGPFSADFPAVLQDRLRPQLGDGFVSVFGEGTAGDTNHIDLFSDRPQPWETETPRIGAAMADAVLTAIPTMTREPRPGVAVRSARVPIPLQEITDEQVVRARDMLALKLVPSPGFLVSVEAYRILWNQKMLQRDGDAMRDEVQAFRLGEDVAVVTLPHEIFVEHGMAIKKRSPFRTTLVISLANDVDFYVPTRKAFAEGSYEVCTTPMKPGGGELLVDAAVGLLQELKR